MEYRDVHSSKKIMDRALEIVDNASMSDKQTASIKTFVRALQLGKAGSKVKERRISLYLQFLTRLHEYFKKDLTSLTEKETTQFYEDLQKDKIKKKNGMPYAQASKDEFVKALKRYLGWVWGKDTKKYHKCIRWMKEDYKKSDKKAITLQEAEKVLNFKDETKEAVRNRCLFIFLFDSGARIEEALNVTFDDLKSSKNGNKYFIVHLRGKKTEEADRTLPIPLTTKYLNTWIKEHPTGEGYLFPIQYDNARKIIKNMTKRALKVEINPHELRHSSATHYIQYGGFGAENIGGFYYRYGWKFGSDEALTYIKTHLYGGEAGHEKVVKHIVADRIEELEKEIDLLKKNDQETAKILAKLIEVFQNNREISKNIVKKDWAKMKELTASNLLNTQSAS